MPFVEYVKAGEKDFAEVVDLLNLVFGTYAPHDFELLFPAQYNEKNFMTGTNYIVKEDGRIVANVGTYPADYFICGDILKVSGLTSVAVSSRTRSKGYMKKLMDMAVSDMRENGTDLSFLYGDRQRYEYFGYTPCGVRYDYSCDKNNIRHFFGNSLQSKITLKEAGINDTGLFDEIYELYNSGKAYIKRPRERFADIMATWENKTIGVYNEDRFIGYLSAVKDYTSICEIQITEIDLLGDVINTYLETYKHYGVNITAFPYEKDLNSSLSKFAGSVSVHNDNNFNVMSLVKVVNSFLKLKCENTIIPDGSVTLSIRDTGCLTISISNNQPSVNLTNEKPDAEVTQLEAVQLIFSNYSAFSLPVLEDNIFARCLFPIPLHVRKLDRS